MKSTLVFILCLWAALLPGFAGPIQSHHAAVARKRVAGGGPPPGPPLAGYEIWFSAPDASTRFDAVSGGSPVAPDAALARWEDKSGNGYHWTQSTSGSRPILKAAALNGLDVIRFDAVDDGLSGALGATLKTVFVVISVSGPEQYARFFSQAAAAGNDYDAGGYIPLLNNAGTLSSYTGSFISGASLPSGAHVFASVHSGSTITNYIDGTSIGSGGHSLALAAVRCGIGAVPAFGTGAGASAAIGSDIGEVLGYTTTLTGPEIAAAFTYFRARWGTP